MPTLFSGISMAAQAMLSQQQVIEVIGHNVANANTPGYHRQEAVLKAGMPYAGPSVYGGTYPGQMGSGVVVDFIRRYSLEFFDGRYRREMAESSRWTTESDLLKQVETTMAETSKDGILPKLDAFWNGWQALNADPANMALRADLRERAVDLADGLNWRAESLNTVRQDQNLGVIQRVEEINKIASQVGRLNIEISKVKSAGEAPNDLMDERDGLLDRLSQVAGATVQFEPNGQAMVFIGSHALVFGETTFELVTRPDANNLAQVQWADNQGAFNATKGELAGLLDARDRVIPEQLQNLNDLAHTLITQVNQLHYNGYGLNNATHHNFFTLSDPASTDSALAIRVSSDIDDLGNIATATAPDSPGDGNLAGQIARLQSAAVMNSGQSTMNQFYSGKVGELGLEVSKSVTRAQNRQSVLDELDKMREGASGVSLDEEAANLVKAQKSYQAIARVLTTIDEMLDKVINGMGVVGR